VIHVRTDSAGVVQVRLCDHLPVRTVDSCADVRRVDPRLFQSDQTCLWNQSPVVQWTSEARLC